tara:strand:+ start:82949 stop:84382 length:1434 start_codon:yes stop_codon:yes gene_type:complete
MRRRTAEEAEAILRNAGAEPLEPYSGRFGAPWKARHIACGNVIEARLANLREGRGVCRFCGGVNRGAARRARAEARVREELAGHGWQMSGEYPGADRPWKALHTPCGTEAEIRLNSIRSASDHGCAVCRAQANGHRLWTAETAWQFMLDAGLTPLEPYPGSSSRNWRARHDQCGREVSPRLGNIAQGQGPCRDCGQEAAHKKFMLDEDIARALMIQAGLEPLVAFPGVDHPWPSVHVECGRETSPSYTNIKRGQGGCNHCGSRVLADIFRMPGEQARVIMLEHGLEPLVPYVNSRTPWLSAHSCGRMVSPTLGNVSQGRGVCRYCNSSFPFDGPAIIYCVADANAVKVGIAKPTGSRIAAHTSRGWRLRWKLMVKTGDAAYAIEQQIISWWRQELEAAAVYTLAQMPQSGGSETASWDAATAEETLSYARAYAREFDLEIADVHVEDLAIRPSRPASASGPGRNRRGRNATGDPTLF